MQTLRKKTSPLKYKNETTRFLGDGVSFKAKLIGILEVSEARGDKMCQEALCDLKMAIRAAGEHKQRITVNIAIDGLRLRDEKTGDCLYHHPVHKISFIAQDMTDSRAFGYIFGSPDTGHRFFGIKTDKAASQVVIAMRDLFQVVFALKKKEIELAKQHLEKTYLPTSPLFSDNSVKSVEKSKVESKSVSSTSEPKSSGTAVADLVDLELELNSLQQGLNQMERITPSDPFGSKGDPFGDSFVNYPINKLILPPPPSSGRERSNRTSESGSILSNKTPPNTAASVDSTSDSMFSAKTNKEFSFSHDFNSSHEEPSSGDWFTTSFGNSIFEEPTQVVSAESNKDEKHEATKREILSQFDVFTELDPLDPFGEDPFDKEDPFADSDFSRQDPFETEFTTQQLNSLHSVFQNNLPRSPKAASLEKHVSLGTSPQALQNFNKSNTFDVHFSDFSNRKADTLSKVQGQSLEISSESESAPEPPPRPAATLGDIQPPPLPPKKQNDIVLKPPPRPPHIEESRYDYLDNFDKDNKITDFKNTIEKSPPIPVPLRKSKFESDFTAPPERPKKPNQQSSDEDYLTPISFPENNGGSHPGILLPPPQRHAKKEQNRDQQTVLSFLESKPNSTNNTSTDSLNNSLDSLDITLSQLTLSGLNELAAKLKIPAHKLSNMTLVQLTNYLSTFIKSESHRQKTSDSDNKFPAFEVDFAANFGKFNSETTIPSTEASYDRYAVFRELQEEIKQTKIDTEPEQIQEEKEKVETSVSSEPQTDYENKPSSDDKYAALREIVEIEIKQAELSKDHENQNVIKNEFDEKTNKLNVVNEDQKSSVHDINQANKEHSLHEQPEKDISKNCIMEYLPETIESISKNPTPEKSPLRSPVMKNSAITEIIQTNARLTSGSLSDVLSGSSPEVDNTGSNSDIAKKNLDPAGESWAIFDQNSVPIDAKENSGAVQSEEGVSPWSSDSKEFGNRSPTEWKKDSKGERWKKHRDHKDWWDASADPEGPYYPANRRSTDSYDDEYYECYNQRPRRRRPQGGAEWQHGAGRQSAGGHSSSSRDVSPWEEEPRRREGRSGWGRHSRGHSFDRHRDMKHVDSWDEDDDYEYDEEHRMRGHYFQRHGSKDSERHSSGGSRDMESDRWDDYSSDRRYRRRRETGRDSKDLKDRWCCPDWEQDDHPDKSGRYGPRRTTLPERRDRYDEKYRSSRDSQESPWEDEYSNEIDEAHSPHFSVTKKNWKQRPSSASEMDRKTGEIKSRHYLGTGGSDGERDRRFKGNRRSRSRDSQFSEPSHRHKSETLAVRNQHRSKPHKVVESEYIEMPSKKVPQENDLANKKFATSRKKTKDTGNPKDEPTVNTFPRKGPNRTKSMFESEFVPSDESPIIRNLGNKFNFENEFENTSSESPIVNRNLKGLRQQKLVDKSQLRLEKNLRDRRSESFQESKLSPRYQPKPRSPFEDDFSPTEKSDQIIEGSGISSIKEEPDLPEEEEDSFGATSLKNPPNGRKKILNKNRLSGGRTDVNLKKSESVNIFSRENDPFDDDFFYVGNNGQEVIKKNTELRWTEEFEDSDSGKK